MFPYLFSDNSTTAAPTNTFAKTSIKYSSSYISSTEKHENMTAGTSIISLKSTESVLGKTDEQTRQKRLRVVIAVCSVAGFVLVVAVIVTVVKITMAKSKSSGRRGLGRFQFPLTFFHSVE